MFWESHNTKDILTQSGLVIEVWGKIRNPNRIATSDSCVSDDSGVISPFNLSAVPRIAGYQTSHSKELW